MITPNKIDWFDLVFWKEILTEYTNHGNHHMWSKNTITRERNKGVTGLKKAELLQLPRTGKKTAKTEPVKKEPVKKEPVKKEPIKKEPVKKNQWRKYQ